MRAVILAVFGILLATSPVMAQASGHVFGTSTCQQKIPCTDAPESMSSSDLAAAGNACVAKSFGISSVDGLFDEYSGLDANGCLTHKSQDNSPKKIQPLCCVVKLPTNSCTFRCQMMSN